jgi:hypothetical protein
MVAATRAADVPPLTSRGAGADPFDPPVDAKAGWSSMCRSGSHSVCKTAQAHCTCACHGPKAQAPPPPPIRKKTPVTVKKQHASAAIGLKVCDPPKGSRRIGNVERFAPVIAELRELPRGTWARLATWVSRNSAHSARKNLADANPDIEFRAALLPDGAGSGLWARVKS